MSDEKNKKAMGQFTMVDYERFFRCILEKSDSEYFIVDSFPLKTYEKHKSFRARIFRGKRPATRLQKSNIFFGIKDHMIIDENGIPIEFCFTPESASAMRD